MLTEEQVLRVLLRADLLSGWQVLPPDPNKAQERARAWAEVLDNRLTYAEAIDIVEEHCRKQRRPLAVADLNEPVERRHATGAPGSTGALHRILQQQREAVPCPPDVDLHRFRGVTPRYRTQAPAQQPGRATGPHLPTEPSDPDSSHTQPDGSHERDAADGFTDQVQELPDPPPAPDHPNTRTLGA